MIEPAEALVRLLALAEPVSLETVRLSDALGRYVAVPVAAIRTQPSRDLSAMDGYAVRSADQAGPWRIAGESAAGTPHRGTIGENEAIRISTGAAVPDGADMIIVQEDVTRTGDRLMTNAASAKSVISHIRQAGSDFETGAILVDVGERLTAARIGLAAMGGHASVVVRRRIRVAIISTGNELARVGNSPDPDQLPSSNAIMLGTMLNALPVDVTDFGIVPDDRAALAAAFEGATDFDVVVSTGGASVGDHDFVQRALIDGGGTIDFWKIAMRPGKPMIVGQLGKAIALGLPGNPVSAFVTATLFLIPLIAHLLGAKRPQPFSITARLAADMPAVGNRNDYVRGYWLGGAIVPLAGDSGMLMPLAAATALIIRPAGSPSALKGQEVDAIMLS